MKNVEAARNVRTASCLGEWGESSGRSGGCTRGHSVATKETWD
jgi:hypothetical protein